MSVVIIAVTLLYIHNMNQGNKCEPQRVNIVCKTIPLWGAANAAVIAKQNQTVEADTAAIQFRFKLLITVQQCWPLASQQLR